MFTTSCLLVKKQLSVTNLRRHLASTSPSPFLLSSIVAPITVRTCTDIYKQLRQTSPFAQFYQKTPLTGFNLTVNYADSALNSDPSQFDKTILAIHGVYGYYSHFERLFKHFHGSRIRVIAPNMPDFTHTQEHGFWHSTIEKGSFIKDFLLKLGVQEIDCLVAHSSGIQTAGTLWGKSGPICVKSLAFCSPQTGWIEYNPKVNHMAKVFIFRNSIWYKFLELLRIHRSSYWPMKYNNMNEFLTTALIFLDPNTITDLYPRVHHLVHETSTPISIIGGANDRLIYPKSNAEFHKKLGIDIADVVLIDPEVDRVEEVMVKTGKRINSYSVKSSGHFTHQKYANFANKMIENLLDL